MRKNTKQMLLRLVLALFVSVLLIGSSLSVFGIKNRIENTHDVGFTFILPEYHIEDIETNEQSFEKIIMTNSGKTAEWGKPEK